LSAENEVMLTMLPAFSCPANLTGGRLGADERRAEVTFMSASHSSSGIVKTGPVG
jgi:hypothetical protein